MDPVDIGGFEWDDDKASSNHEKHGVSFEEAAEAVLNADEITEGYVTRNEMRHAVVALSSCGRMLLVVITFRGNDVRIISAHRYRK